MYYQTRNKDWLDTYAMLTEEVSVLKESVKDMEQYDEAFNYDDSEENPFK